MSKKKTLPPRTDSAKLTEQGVRQIRRYYSLGDWTYQQLANRYGVSFSTIGKVVRKEVWKWVK